MPKGTVIKVKVIGLATLKGNNITLGITNPEDKPYFLLHIELDRGTFVDNQAVLTDGTVWYRAYTPGDDCPDFRYVRSASYRRPELEYTQEAKDIMWAVIRQYQTEHKG